MNLNEQLRQAYQRGYRQGLNEASSPPIGGGLPAVSKNQFQTQAPTPEGMPGGGDPNPGSWFYAWLSQYGQLWFDLMHQGESANWAQIPGFEPMYDNGTWQWTTQQGTFDIYWNGYAWAGFPDWPFPE